MQTSASARRVYYKRGGCYSLWTRRTDRQTDKRTDKSNAYCPLPYRRSIKREMSHCMWWTDMEKRSDDCDGNVQQLDGVLVHTQDDPSHTSAGRLRDDEQNVGCEFRDNSERFRRISLWLAGCGRGRYQLDCMASSVNFGCVQRFNAHIDTAQQRTITQQYGDWYPGRWWVGCYISSLYQM